MIEKLREILVKMFPETENIEIIEETRLREDIGLDSLATMMMAMEIEDAFGIEFAEFKPFKTVGEVLDYIKEKTAK